MRLCNCSLAGTSACLRCNNSAGSFDFIDWIGTNWHPTITTNLIINTDMGKQLVDTSKYDVIEKKETKIARLKSELDGYTNDLDGLLVGLKSITGLIKESEDNIEKIKQELTELEKEEVK